MKSWLILPNLRLISHNYTHNKIDLFLETVQGSKLADICRVPTRAAPPILNRGRGHGLQARSLPPPPPPVGGGAGWEVTGAAVPDGWGRGRAQTAREERTRGGGRRAGLPGTSAQWGGAGREVTAAAAQDQLMGRRFNR